MGFSSRTRFRKNGSDDTKCLSFRISRACKSLVCAQNPQGGDTAGSAPLVPFSQNTSSAQHGLGMAGGLRHKGH